MRLKPNNILSTFCLEFQFGGGGGSYNAGITQNNIALNNIGNGKIVMTYVYYATISQTATITCNGQSIASLSVNLTGGVGPYTYSWSPGGGTGTTLSGLSAGVYTVMVTDANSLVTSTTYTISQPPVIAVSQSLTLCAGQSVMVGANTYSTAGTYTDVLTSAKGCDSTVTTNLTLNALPTISVTGAIAVCTGGTTTLTASGVNTFTWTPITATPLDVVSGYQLAIGLRKLVSTYTGPAIRLRRVSDNVEQDFGFVGTELDVAAINAFLSSTQGFCVTMYDQSGMGSNVTQANQSQQPSYVANGINGKPVIRCDASATQNLYNTINYPSPFTAIYAAQQNGPSQQRMLTSYANNWLLGWWGGSNQQAFYEGWISLGGNTPDGNPTLYSGTSDGSTAGTLYENGTLLYSNAGGLTGPDGIDLGAWQNSGEASDGDFTEVFVFNSVLSNPDRQAVENSTAAYYGLYYSNVVTGTSNIVTPLVNTTYMVTGTDNNGCTNTTQATVVVNALPTVTVSSGAICAGNSYTMTAGGANTYTYSSGSAIVTPSGDASYTVTGTDANNCVNTAVATVTVNALPSVTVNSGAINCNGQATTLTVTASGGTSPYTGGGTFTVMANSYTYTVADANSCSTSTIVTVTEPNLLVASSTSGTISCNGGMTSVNVSEAGGTSPYSGDGVMSSISAGSYSYTVTDANGCTSTSTITVSEPNAITSVQSPTICAGSSLVVGTHTYTTANTYTDVLTAHNGCDSTVTTNLNVSSITAAFTYSLVSCCNQIGYSDSSYGAPAVSWHWSFTSTTGYPFQTSTQQNPFEYMGFGTNAVCLKVTTQLGCVDSICKNVYENIQGINKYSNGPELTVYPNPAQNNFTIQTTSTEKLTLEMFDVNGRLVLSQNINGTTNIDATNIVAGVYNINLTSAYGLSNKRLVIVK